MTHPLTPREKVARALSPKCWEFYDRHVDDPRMAAEIKHEVAPSLDATDAIITALASGSGDHAELARQLHAVIVDPSGICSQAGHAIEALLAENAALRAERDEWRDTAFKARSSNTRAERKLAEAVEVIEFYAKTHTWRSSTVYMCGNSGRTRAESDGGNRARAFLSKEAERG